MKDGPPSAGTFVPLSMKQYRWRDQLVRHLLERSNVDNILVEGLEFLVEGLRQD